MNQDYVGREVEKIYQNDEYPYPLNLAMACAWIVANLKGINLKIFDVHGKSTLADYFVIVDAQNPTQAQAMADEIMYRLKKYKIRASSVEGLDEANWILLDLRDVIVHVFLESVRNIYDLDTMWKDAKQVKIPDTFYYQAAEAEQTSGNKKSNSTEGYF